jgi:hypothetical protein
VNSESEEGASALRFAIGLALDEHARLVVIAVVPLALAYTPDVTSAEAGAETERRILRHHERSVSDMPHEPGVESRVPYGSPRGRFSTRARLVDATSWSSLSHTGRACSVD